MVIIVQCIGNDIHNNVSQDSMIKYHNIAAQESLTKPGWYLQLIKIKTGKSEVEQFRNYI